MIVISWGMRISGGHFSDFSFCHLLEIRGMGERWNGFRSGFLRTVRIAPLVLFLRPARAIIGTHMVWFLIASPCPAWALLWLSVSPLFSFLAFYFFYFEAIFSFENLENSVSFS
ncbi:MAG: hypothetical protein OXG62_07270 [Nitrospinae bacterium]|nr:hypothetical protein [Nitrospinota bacterium]